MDKLSKKLYGNIARENKLNKFFFGKYVFDYNLVPLTKDADFVSGLCLIDKSFGVYFNAAVCPFLSAGYTKPEQRNRGFFKQVIEKTVNRVYNQRMPFCLVNCDYMSIYEKFGFETFAYGKKVRIDFENNEYQYETITGRNIADVFEIYMLYISRFNFLIRRSLQDFKEMLKMFSKIGKDAYIIKKNGINIGYYFFGDKGISELVMLSKRFMETATTAVDGNLLIPCKFDDAGAQPVSMLRVCNIEKFLSMLRPKGDKSLRIRLSDNQIKENNGIFKIEICQGIVKVTKAKKFDYEMTIKEFTSSVIGKECEKDYFKDWFESSEPLIFDKF